MNSSINNKFAAVTFVALVDVPEVFPIVVFNDVDDRSCVVRRDVQFERSMRLPVWMKTVSAGLGGRSLGEVGVIKGGVGEYERHVKGRAKGTNCSDGGRCLGSEKREHAARHHFADYTAQ